MLHRDDGNFLFGRISAQWGVWVRAGIAAMIVNTALGYAWSLLNLIYFGRLGLQSAQIFIVVVESAGFTGARAQSSPLILG